MINIINEINKENGSNYKLAVLKKHKNNELLKRVLKMTYDRVSYTYGLSLKNISGFQPQNIDMVGELTLEFCLASIEANLSTRDVTGNAALQLLSNLLGNTSQDNAKIIEGIINRDLRINMGRSSINKVFKDLIVKPPYTRCEIGTKANVTKNIDFNKKVFSQEKMDGTFRRAVVDGDTIEITSRPGIEDEFPIVEKQLRLLEADGYVFIGEMTLSGEKDRQKGNGLINSDNKPHEDIIFTVWDMVPLSEYSMSKDEIKQEEAKGTMSLYEDRFAKLEELLYRHNLSNVALINYKIVKSMKEAYEHFHEIVKNGGEGTVIKAHDMTHKDGNSKKQLKVKLEIPLDVRCTGFTDGKKGTSREATFGAMTFTNDEGTIVGQCSGFTDEALKEINANREAYIGKVFEIKCNDITLARNKTAYALSHGNFQKWRSKNETDSLERALEQKEMAMELK